MYGRLTNINCEEGDKLRLICFELSTDPRQLRSVIHSFIKVGTSGEYHFSNIEDFKKTRLTVLSIILSLREREREREKEIFNHFEERNLREAFKVQKIS